MKEQSTNDHIVQQAHEPVRQHSWMSRVQLLVLGFFVATLVLTSPLSSPRAGAYLTERSVSIASSQPGVITYHDFEFTAVGSPSIGSVAFEYCGNSPLIGIPCVAPAGFDSSGANLTFQNGDVNYSIHPDTALTANRIVITRVPSASSAGVKQYRFDDLVNPTLPGTTTYVRIFTYATDDGTGAYDDTGSVAFTTLNPLSVSVYVPPHLTMCSGITIAIDCSSTIGDVVDLGELSKTASNSATTQFAVATNSFNGYSALLVGPTMTAGNRTIPALTIPSLSQPGVSQFGINLRDNSNPNTGANVEGLGTGVPTAGYNTPNVFRFQSGDTIASSPLSTDWNRFTITYLVNVADGQPAGRYSSTLTVIATTTF